MIDPPSDHDGQEPCHVELSDQRCRVCGERLSITTVGEGFDTHPHCDLIDWNPP